MAIYTGPSVTPLRQVNSGGMLTVGAQGSRIITPPTNNRSRGGHGYRGGQSPGQPGFANIDALILHLDALFDALPNQADWTTYAANITGEWSLCANCDPGASGKKLFRQYNFNRFQLGLPITTTPVSNVEFADAGLNSVFGDSEPPPPFSAGGTGGIQTQPIWYTFQTNAQLANPTILIPPALGFWNWASTDPAYTFFLNLVTAQFGATPGSVSSGPITACTMTTTGAPGLRYAIMFDWAF